MAKHEITLAQVQEMSEKGISTFSRKDNSVRGVETVSADEIKVGDKIVIDNYFHTVTEWQQVEYRQVQEAQKRMVY